MPFVQTGTGAPIEGRADRYVDGLGSRTIVRRWRGKYAALEAMLQGAVVIGSVSVQLTADADSPLGQLEITYINQDPGVPPEPEAAVDTIELDCNPAETSIWAAPAFAAWDYSDVGAVQRALTEFNANGTLPGTPPNLTDFPGAVHVGLCKDVFGHLAIGIDTYKYTTGVATWTRQVSRQWPNNVNGKELNRIFSTAQLASYLNVASGTALAILLWDINDFGTAYPSPGASAFQRGWMKTAANLSFSASSAAILREVWEFGSFSKVLYTASAYVVPP